MQDRSTQRGPLSMDDMLIARFLHNSEVMGKMAHLVSLVPNAPFCNHTRDISNRLELTNIQYANRR